jgi:hypothetical protein
MDNTLQRKNARFMIAYFGLSLFGRVGSAQKESGTRVFYYDGVGIGKRAVVVKLERNKYSRVVPYLVVIVRCLRVIKPISRGNARLLSEQAKEKRS